MSVSVEVADKVATITLNRPDRLNSYDVRMKDDLVAAFDKLDASDEVAVVVVTGAGRAFCAGMELSQGPAAFTELENDSGGELTLRIFASTKPVIGAINGAAVGIGATMTLPMDIRLASTKAKFGFVFSRVGITLESCASWFLPRLVGISQAAEWAYTGRVFGAAEAREAGLVRSVHEPDDLLPAAYALAKEIAAAAPVSVALNRQLLWRGLAASHPRDMHGPESLALRLRGASPDCAEGIGAFMDKRSPVFSQTVPADLPEVFPS